jgi:hypothetical protein
MTVAAESYEASSLGLVVTMLSNSARFRLRAGVDSATTGLGRILESLGGTPAEHGGKSGEGIAVDGSRINLSTDFHAIVGLPDGMSSQIGGIGYDDREFTVGIQLVHQRRLSDDETPADGARRVLNDTGVIRAELEALRGGSNALADFEIASSGLFMDEEGVHKNHIVTELTITARG